MRFGSSCTPMSASSWTSCSMRSLSHGLPWSESVCRNHSEVFASIYLEEPAASAPKTDANAGGVANLKPRLAVCPVENGFGCVGGQLALIAAEGEQRLAVKALTA